MYKINAVGDQTYRGLPRCRNKKGHEQGCWPALSINLVQDGGLLLGPVLMGSIAKTMDEEDALFSMVACCWD